MTYWAMYLLAAMAATFPLKSDLNLRFFLLMLLGVGYVLLIGLRYEVGGDWNNYLLIYNSVASLPSDMLDIAFEASGDYAYVLVEIIMIKLGWGIYGVNLVCGTLFISGMFALARRQPLPWVAIVVVVPYLLVVVAMGYTRQSAALGLVCWGLSVLRKDRIGLYVALVLLAALFHKTAVLMLPFAFLVVEYKKNIIMYLMIAASSVVLIGCFLQTYYEIFMERYIASKVSSDGGPIRVVMNVMASLVMFLVWWRWKKRFDDYRVWFWMAVLSMFCLLLVPFASTAVDRIALYLAPLQLVVYSRLPVLVNPMMSRSLVVVGVVLVYAMVLFVWLTFGNYSSYWLPYKNILWS